VNHRRSTTDFARSVDAIAAHRQGHHGWAAAHRAIGRLLADGLEELERLLATTWVARPDISDAHLLTLLGVAIRDIAMRDPVAAGVFQDDLDDSARAELLREVVRQYEMDLARALRDRSNSFTGARRFVVPQLLVGAFAANLALPEVRLVDLGTGLGLLPRQLNNRAVFDRFAPDLSWDRATPAYRPIPLTLRCGVDTFPLPTLDWVRACYGNSRYYEDRFGELLWSLEQTRDTAQDVVTHVLDMLELRQMAEFLSTYRFNVATCNFALFQHDQNTRRMIVNCVVSRLQRPGLLLTMDPSHGLTSPGASVTGYLAGDPTELRLAEISDAHFIGTVTCGPHLSSIVGDAWGIDAH